MFKVRCFGLEIAYSCSFWEFAGIFPPKDITHQCCLTPKSTPFVEARRFSHKV